MTIGSGPFEKAYAEDVHKTGFSRWDEEERKEFLGYMESNENLSNSANLRLDRLLEKADAYDPLPLSSMLKEFRFVLLKNCGHKPWIERRAKEDFFKILRQGLARA